MQIYNNYKMEIKTVLFKFTKLMIFLLKLQVIEIDIYGLNNLNSAYNEFSKFEYYTLQFS